MLEGVVGVKQVPNRTLNSGLPLWSLWSGRTGAEDGGRVDS